MKICSRCEIEKDNTKFGIDNSKKDGLTSWCKECWRLYRKSNRKKISIRNKDYRDKNPEKIVTALESWKNKNPNYNTEYYSKNRESCIKKVKIWRRNNQDKVFNQNMKRRLKINFSILDKQEWIRIMNMTDWKCFYCNISLSKKNRTIDHILSINFGGPNTIENCVPACVSCNCSKKDTLVYDWVKFNYLPIKKKQHLTNILQKLGVIIER